MKLSPLLLALVLPVFVGCAVQAEPEDATTAADSQDLSVKVAGHFGSRVCEPFDATTYQERHYTIGLGGTTATWERFSSADCSPASKLATIIMSGTAKFTGLSRTVEGALEISVNIDKKTITPTAAGVAMLGRMCKGYSWEAGTPRSVTSGCGELLQQDESCPTEYDLLKVTHLGLVYGDRSRPLCSKEDRPTTLSQWAVALKL
jgi:hypothetical protein